MIEENKTNAADVFFADKIKSYMEQKEISV